MTDETIHNFIQEIIDTDLANGKHQAIQTRFPPEPNGYLHIGHAKSICLNFGLAAQFGGKCNLRFDDTNPEKEEETYMHAIKEDISWLGYQWDALCFASDYFETLYQLAVQLIEAGLAYVDNQTTEAIRLGRGSLTEPGAESPYRERSVDENLAHFKKMRDGEYADGDAVLRAKIDMQSPNMNMRDPVIYRVRRAHHFRTGNHWCIYPLYDFTHGLSDMIEGVTHSLCTLEFEDHRPLYDWFIRVLNTPCQPRQIEFARLQLEYTVLSKRRLIQLVEKGHVDGWDDPRMPTIAGMRRRGVPPQVIRDFCHKIGITKKDATIEMEFFDGLLRDTLNSHAPRRMAVINPITVTLINYPEETVENLTIANHPQNAEMGTRQIPFSKHLYIEREDFKETANNKFKRLVLGGEVRLRGAYVIRCEQIIFDEKTGEPIELLCHYDSDTLGKNPADGRKVKGVIHWVSKPHAIDACVIEYDRLFTEPNPMKSEHFTDVINADSKRVIDTAKLEPALADAPIGLTYQFERIGYFTYDAEKLNGQRRFNQTISLREGG